MSIVDVDKIFMAYPKNTIGFLIVEGQGCYIPSYQRHYSWDNDNVNRLFEDAINGINQLQSRKDTISFLGTIIAIHDTKLKTVKPVFKPEVAPKVMTIIDGQQRLCTFLMINIVLHNYFFNFFRKFKKFEKEAHFKWISEQCEELLAKLFKAICIDMSTGDDAFRFYPRIIRAYDDVWSKRKNQAIYKSPMASLLWKYISHAKKDDREQFDFILNFDDVATDKNRKLYLNLKLIFDLIKREIKNISSGDEKYNFPDLIRVSNNNVFLESIWGYELPVEVKSYIQEKNEDKLYKEFSQAFRMIILARYINERIAFTIVQTENEDDAFDMFEALNTTGAPLTAIETFKPKVIDQEGIDKYEQSPSYPYFLRIEEFLSAYDKAEQKHKATSDLLIPFALSETGDKIQKKLNDQRRFLREKFDEIDNISEKRDFVQSLSYLAQFMKNTWALSWSDIPNFSPLNLEDKEVLLCFEILRKLNHSITIAHLFRFFEYAVMASDSQKKDRTEEFYNAIKATAGFSILWRAAKRGTANIDAYYRDILKTGINDKSLGIFIPALARHRKDKKGVLSLENYKKALNYFLKQKGSFVEKEDWVKVVSKEPIFETGSAVAKFILFCASHDAIPDDAVGGLIKRGRKNISPIFDVELFKSDDYFSVEHIAPQTNDGKWSSDIYEDKTTIHRLGNLTLLPEKENTLLGNRPWNEKKLFYSMMCSVTNEEFCQYKEKLKECGISLSKRSEDIIEKAKYLGICKSIITYKKEWSLEIIEMRSKRIAELAWDKIIEWLN
jgi:hypothetical protein